MTFLSLKGIFHQLEKNNLINSLWNLKRDHTRHWKHTLRLDLFLPVFHPGLRLDLGTYGNVFKASKGSKIYAIKKFKPEKEGEAALQSGISQSAVREIGICREMRHENVVFLEEVVVDSRDRSIAMVFDYAEHDLLVRGFCDNM